MNEDESLDSWLEAQEVDGCEDPGPEPAKDDFSAGPADGEKSKKLAEADQAAQSQDDAAPNDPVQYCPLKQGSAIEAIVVDQLGKPVADAGVQLLKSDSEALLGKTGVSGKVRFAGLEPGGSYQISLIDVDQDLWNVSATEDLSRERANCKVGAPWSAPPEGRGRGPIQHTVAQGETVSLLAVQYGLLPDAIWNSPGNQSLKKQRDCRDVLYPGDQLEIPEPKLKKAPAQAGKLYHIQKKAPPLMLHVRFLDANDQPRSGLSYLITMRSAEGDEDRKGATDGDGFLHEPLTPKIHSAEVTLCYGDDQEFHEFRLGHLDPVDTISGLQQRLNNLGYLCGKETAMGPWTAGALADFHSDQKIDGLTDDDYQKMAGGDFGDAIRQKLKPTFDRLEKAHLC